LIHFASEHFKGVLRLHARVVERGFRHCWWLGRLLASLAHDAMRYYVVIRRSVDFFVHVYIMRDAVQLLVMVAD
jgi:hypothetical protein